ncbi:hypothetical protein FEM48_Zijuj04G0102700 [Ziziphus jujuba var. spinosa]|uniref:ABC transporter domain-containing protein n=1 Tax=Ziziphus jujuba var. spinosa TaxID=714518 RepID=A0A978VJA9_ZIZJJ|nr:hypothetical protein FEM48_Zijuj04G0102700 [Ziziphus jujuba var. spinosa]
MEILPRKPDSGGKQKTQFRITTKKLSYKLSRRVTDHYRFCSVYKREVSPGAYILKNVTCEAKPGHISAIAGPSGAGKTTLLEILAGVVPTNRISGRVLVNEQPMNAEYFRRVSGYVTQDEALFPLLSVEETLMYSARLRMHGDLKRARYRVGELLKELGLEQVANVRIGSESCRSISGGEKRRVSIGVDLVHDPAVLLLDEPTSGLDSASAFYVTLLLKSMAAKQGKTVLLTIHQPGFRILELFDQILLLSNGTLLHRGSLQLLEQRLGFLGYTIPRHVNVMEFAMEVTEALVMNIDQESEMDESELEEQYEYLPTNLIPDNLSENKLFYANPPLNEVLILSQRFSNNIFRTKELFLARIIQAILAGFVLGTIFMNVTNDKKRVKFQTHIGFFAYSLTFLLSSTTEGLPIYLQERRILMRETSRGAYRVSSYVISNTLVFLPFLLMVAILYTIPVYWLVGLRRQIDGFLYFTMVVWMVILMSNSFVACFSALVQNFITGTSLVAGVMGSFFLFSGYFITKEDIPKYWIFMHYLSLFKYPFECFMINEYGGEHGRSRCLASVEDQCLLYGDQFLTQKGLKESQKWGNLSVMFGFIIGYRFLCFLILWYRSRRARS